MAGTRKLVIEILGNAKDASQAFGDVRKQSDITKERLGKFGDAAIGTGLAIAGGLAIAVGQFVDADVAARKLADSIGNSESTFKNGGKAINDLATAVQNKSGADGDALIGASSLAVQWGLQEDAVLALLPLVNDLSMKMGVGVDQAMKAVLKSTDGSTGALGKMGLNMSGVKDAADPFAATIDALQKQVGGFGDEIGGTAAGKVGILKQQLGDLVEAIGGGAMDVFGPVISGISNFVSGAGPAGQAAGDIAGKVLAIGSAGLIAVGGIAKIAGAFSTAKDALTDAQGNMNNFGKAAQGVGMAAGGIGLAFAAWEVSQAINNATRDTMGFETALNRLKSSTGVAETSGSIVEMARATDGLVDKGWDVYNQFTNIGNLFGQHLFGSQTVEIDGMTLGVDSLKRMFENLQKAGNLEELNRSLAYVKENADGDQQSMGDLNKVLDNFERYSKSAAKAAKTEADAHGEAAQAADEQNSALRALADPVFAAIRATDQNADAQHKFIDAQNKVNFLTQIGRTNTSDFAQAQRDMQSAAVDAGSAAIGQQSAFTTLGGLMKDNKDFTGDFNGALATLQDKFGLSGDAANIMALRLAGISQPAQNSAGDVRGVGRAADEIDGRRPKVTVTAETGDAMRKFDELLGKYGLLQGLGLFLTARSTPSKEPRRATGGTTQAGRPYLVGERGPEVVVPGSGYVIPTRRLVDAPAGGGTTTGGVTVNVTTGVGDPAAIGRGVVDALKAYERTAGTSWRN